MDAPATPTRRRRGKTIMLAILVLFILPIAARAALYIYDGGPRSWRDADWSSIGSLPSAATEPEARLLIMSSRTGGWKGVFSVHSWIVLKPKNATAWRRYDVVGWGSPVRLNGWAPDSRWFGNNPQVIADIKGVEAETLIPRVEAAIRAYRFSHAGDYRIWPGPNSNTFVANILRAVPEIGVAMPPNAVGRDYRSLPHIGLTDSGTGIELSLWGALGIKLGWVEGVELNFLGLVAGLDLRDPGVKVPGFGTLGLNNRTAIAAPLHQ